MTSPVVKKRVDCVVIIPVYKPTLDPLEKFSVDYATQRLQGRDIFFIAPETLDITYYTQHYPDIRVQRFDNSYFASIKGYNQLLLHPDFYTHWGGNYEFTLILQTDAIVLRDELSYWCKQPYDYIGAPWPDGLEIFVNLDCFSGNLGKKAKVYVGNGGLSLRRNAACIGLLQEFPLAVDMFLKSGSSEDIFFSLMGSLSLNFKIPNERVAALFALELQPDHYFALNAERHPMGGHAWWRYNQPFWLKLLDTQPPVLLPANPPGRPTLSANTLR